MKKLLSLAIVALFSLNAMAQTVDQRKKINVSGTAETEITPDILYINISLKEYLKDGNSKKKVNITDLENELFDAVQKAGISKDNLTINNLSSYSTVISKKKDPEYLASKQYRLKVTDLNKWNNIIGSIDPKGILSTNIDGYDYSKIESLRKELKIKAILAAKDKATYLVEALGDKLGSAIDIQEISNDVFPQPMYRSNVMMMKAESADMAGAPAAEIDFKKIKLSYTMNVVFQIKGI